MYTCKYCEKEFKDKSHLTRHENAHVNLPEKVNCPFCLHEFKKVGITNHIKFCKSNPSRISEELKCQFCDRLCNNTNSLIHHERLCKNNPDRMIFLNLKKRKRSKSAWNKGLTKDTDERIRLGTIKSKEKVKEYYATHEGTFKGKHHSEETKEKLRQIALEHEHEKHFRRRCDIEYRGFKFHSTYESSLAQNLDENNIKWIQPKRIPYKDLENKLHYYTADFYLPDYNIYLDPKNDFLINSINPYFGYKDIDKIRWVMEQNNVKILILNKDQLTWEALKPLIYAE